jgi:crossover junction endodeoxyribonuclease RuvC
MIVLGVDPGTLRTGWGVVRRMGSRLQGIDAGVIRAGRETPLAERLLAIYEGLSAILERHHPNCMAVEDVFSKHARSALVLGHARGVALLVGARAAIEVSAYPPALVKRSIAGSGQAPKDQLARIVGAILGWTSLPAEDATDALAIAITHANAALVKRATAPRANSLPGRSGL